MNAAPSKRSAHNRILAQVGRFTAIAGLLFLGACSIPDWADPGSYFEPSYGPAPQPVARTGTDPIPAARPAPGLASATENVQRSGEKPVIAVTQQSATTPSSATPRTTAARAVDTPKPAAPVRVRQVAQAEVPPPKPRASTRTVDTARASTPVVQRSAATQLTGTEQPAAEVMAKPVTRTAAKPKAMPKKPRAKVRTGESPTPMIAAMTQGQRPPSFTEDGGIVERRTDVKPNANLGLDSEREQPVRVARAQPAATAAASQPAPSRTYQQQLQAAGINPVPAPAAEGSGPVQPGQFPSSVSPVVQQTYQEYLNAPRSYSEAIGGQNNSSTGGTVVIGGNGVSGQSTSLTGAAGGADAVIQFGHGSAQLSSNDQSVIRRIASLATQRNSRVRIRGHSSSRTGQMEVDTHLLANLRVSARRAEAVADALARNGVPYERIIVEAKGDNTPVYNEAMPNGEAGNRRAEIYLEN
jgi:outer membrane protein OmpA-like peptidoglycan-associated protein